MGDSGSMQVYQSTNQLSSQEIVQSLFNRFVTEYNKGRERIGKNLYKK